MVTIIHHSRSVGGVCQMVRRAAEALGTQIQVVSDRDENAQPSQVVIRWDSTRELAPGQAEINKAEAVKLCRNKTEARKALGELAPETWFDKTDVRLPAVVRPRKHHAGHKFHVVNTPEQLRVAIKDCKRGWYASPLLQKKAEYRVYVFQGWVTSVSKRTCDDPNQVAWNVALGSKMFKIQRKNWPINVCKVAIQATRNLGLDWAAVDIAITNDDKVVVFEANTAPGLVPNAKSLPLIAKAYVWAEQNPDKTNTEIGDSWQTLLHPALRKA